MVNNAHLEQKLKNFTENMLEIRKRMGWTQEDLASRINKVGLKFYPQTVQKIETGERRIQLGEAIEIARVLGMNLGSMLASPREHDIETRQVEAEAAGMDITSAAMEYLGNQLLLAHLLDDTVAGGHPVPDLAVQSLDNTLEERLDTARRQYISEAESSMEEYGLERRSLAEQIASAGIHAQQAARSLGLPTGEDDDE